LARALDDLVSMAIFARVVEAKSFTGAATALGVSKSVVSKRVAALEAELGTRLLQRTTRRLSLTEEGARLNERCLMLVRLADELPSLFHEKAGELRGVLRVTCPTTFSDLYLGGLIAEFSAQHPQLRIELSVTNALVDLVGERVDVAIRIARHLASSSIVARKLASARRLACAAPSYLEKHGVPRHPDDLRQHACLRFTSIPDDVDWKFYEGERTHVPPVSGPIAADSNLTLRDAALAGAGILTLPIYLAAADLAAGRLVPLLEAYPLAPLFVYAAYPKGKVVPNKVRSFVQHLTSRLAPPPWARAPAAHAASRTG
jgi:DNA-binding transcriptional LysR family regulator